MQQFQRGEQQQRLLVGVVVGDRPPAPVGEDRAQPLAPAEDEILQAGRQRVELGSDVGGLGSTVAQIPAQPVGDGVGQLDGCRCSCAQRDTSSESL
jgi:hypothetical protein